MKPLSARPFRGGKHWKHSRSQWRHQEHLLQIPRRQIRLPEDKSEGRNPQPLIQSLRAYKGQHTPEAFWQPSTFCTREKRLAFSQPNFAPSWTAIQAHHSPLYRGSLVINKGCFKKLFFSPSLPKNPIMPFRVLGYNLTLTSKKDSQIMRKRGTSGQSVGMAPWE